MNHPYTHLLVFLGPASDGNLNIDSPATSGSISGVGGIAGIVPSCPKRPKFGLVVNIRMTSKNPLRRKIVETIKVYTEGMVLFPYLACSTNVIMRTTDSGMMQTQFTIGYLYLHYQECSFELEEIETPTKALPMLSDELHYVGDPTTSSET